MDFERLDERFQVPSMLIDTFARYFVVIPISSRQSNGLKAPNDGYGKFMQFNRYQRLLTTLKKRSIIIHFIGPEDTLQSLREPYAQ